MSALSRRAGRRRCRIFDTLVHMRLAPFLALSTALYAQSATPEIFGRVIEQGPNTGLAGAEVTLTEFVPAPNNDLDPKIFGTVFTDQHGPGSYVLAFRDQRLVLRRRFE